LIHWKTFLEFEEKNDLFNLEEDGLYIWDALRFHVYLDFMWDNYEQQQKRPPFRRLFSRSMKRLWYLLLFVFRKSRPNLFFVHSRDLGEDGRYYDRNVRDFLDRMEDESHVVETCENRSMKYRYPVALFYPAGVFNRLYYWFYRQKDYSSLAEKINAELELNWDSRKINRHLSYFKSERLFYNWLFRFKRTRRVYVSFQLPKSLYCAARENGVETIEFQHGIIDQGHIAYNYPPSINVNSHVYCPDILLTFANFWCRDINLPVKQVIAVGNTAMSRIESPERSLDPSSKVIGFISGNVFGLSLGDLAMDYAKLNPADRILFKLHPNQFSQLKEYRQMFEAYPSIQVITNEQDTEKVILNCDAIVLIQSTTAYQALQVGIPVFIYKRMTYYRHSHIFNRPNVKLIDNARQIVLVDQTPPKNRDIFFEDFHESVYLLLANSH